MTMIIAGEVLLVDELFEERLRRVGFCFFQFFFIKVYRRRRWRVEFLWNCRERYWPLHQKGLECEVKSTYRC